MKPLLELRILSGPALGAAIELGAGTYTIGADDACDLVLAADASVAGRHLELQVREPKGLPPEVFARPLEGEIAVNGAAVMEAGMPLLQGEVLGLGFTALAWQPIGGTWGAITLAPLEFARLTIPETVETVQEVAAAEKTDDAAVTEPPEPEASPAGEEETAVRGTRRPLWVGLGIAVIVLALLALGVTLAIANLPPSPEAAALRLRAALDAAGFQKIRVEPGVAHALALRGMVENDQELRRVFRLAQGLPFRVHVAELRVGNDLLRTMRETLNAHGFFPDVRYADSANGPGGGLVLALYLKDSMVETGMISSLSQDVPELETALRKVVYAQDVAPVLERELARLDLAGERAIYLSGKVVLPFNLDFRAQQALEVALETVRTTLGVPVVFQVSADDPASGAAAAPADGTPADVPPDGSLDLAGKSGGSAAPDALGGLKIMSVTLDRIPFVTMSDQQKFFPGAVLPSGATLVSIHPERLVFQNGADTITYSLKEEP
ncbi:MAG: type III secretion system inner membrane ring subunit SctD [Candidatus Accumulibacter sp.]|jgi:type III secretion system YscD/HrpQ family protein|nr:type III secretion system inner membrane ring subunit SctD [Accumulibacter sp.]